MKKLLFALVIFTCSQGSEVLTFTAVQGGLRTGDTVTALFQAKVEPGWHTYAHSLRQAFLIPTVLTFAESAFVRVLSVDYPKGEEKTFFGFTDLLYDGTVTFGAKVLLLPGHGDTLTAMLRYQACDSMQCLPPAIEEVSLPVPKPAASSTDDWFSGHGMLYVLFFLFIGGIALNLTPCVYPVIPITISFFSTQAEGKKRAISLLAALYVLGIALTYSALGTAAALSGKIMGSALQHPTVIWGVAGIFFLLSFSMFGLYELRAPLFLMRFGIGKQGYAGALIMGLVVGVIAAPCVGPVTAGLLIHVAEKKDPFLGFLYFFTLATGLGAPYFVLALFSGSIKSLPGSGGWMVWVKKFFGFLLLGMALYYLKPVAPAVVVTVCAGILLLAAAVYLGFVEKSAGERFLRFRRFQRLFGAALNMIFVYFYSTILIAPPHVGHVSAHRTYGLPTGERLQELTEQGKPFVIDFRADWCAPCRKFEEQVLTDSTVQAALSPYVFFSVDVTNAADGAANSYIKKYAVVGVPTILFFNSQGLETNRVTEFIPRDRFIELLNSLSGGR